MSQPNKPKGKLSARSLIIIGVIVVLIAAALLYAILNDRDKTDQTSSVNATTDIASTEKTQSNANTAETAAVEPSDSNTDVAVAADNGVLGKIISKNQIVVAMEGTWMPWTYHDQETGELTGFDFEVANAIASKLGVKAKFEECPWDSIFAGMVQR